MTSHRKPPSLILADLQQEERNLELLFRDWVKEMKDAPEGYKIAMSVKFQLLTTAHLRVQDAIANLVSLINLQA